MARKHAQVLTSIWQDPEFVALSDSARLTYLFLLAQPDLSLAGVLVARPGAWSRRGAPKDEADTRGALTELCGGGWICWDEDTDEVWIRSFIKHNVGASPKALIGASRAYEAVMSDALRGRIAESVHPDLRDRFCSGLDRMEFQELRSTVAALPPWDTPSYTPSERVSEGVYATETGDLIPETGDRRPENHSPDEPGTSLALIAEPAPPAAPAASNYSDRFEAFWKVYPRKTGKGAAAKAFQKALRQPTVTAERITDAARTHGAEWASWPSSEHQFIPHPATWLNEARYDDPPPAPRGQSGPVTKADRNEAALIASARNMGVIP